MTAPTDRRLENRPSLAEIDRASVVHPFSVLAAQAKATPRVIASAERITLTDSDGREYIDAASGLWCVNIGYGRNEIAEVMAEQARCLAYGTNFGGYSHEPLIRLSEQLLTLAPANMTKVFFSNSGSEANDTQIKLARLYNNLRGKPEKKKIIARHGGYHGSTLGAGSLTGHAFVHHGFDMPVAGILHARNPDYYRRADAGLSRAEFSRQMADDLERLIEREGPDTIAAFIAEPIMGSGGIIVPPEGYFDAVQEVLKRHDVLLIADEVITGFGRVGAWFACEAFGIEPDLISCAKGLTSGYMPMAACLIGEKVWQVLVADPAKAGVFGHGFTSSGHPIAAAVALKNIEIIEREELAQNAVRVGAHLLAQLRARLGEHPLVGDIRGHGMMVGVELDANKDERRPFDNAMAIGSRFGGCCADEGLVVRGGLGKAMAALAPPLILTMSEADEIVDRVSNAIDRLAGQLEAEKLWPA